MKRPSDGDDDSSPESKAEEFAQRVLARSRKLILIGSIVLAIVIIVAPAGWYRYLASPGEPGPAVILGHVDTRSGPAVFHRLGVLRRGDLVRVTRQDGRVVRFRVTDVVLVAKSAFPTQAVYGATVLPTLRLVTCGGTFDRRAHSYTGNTVVFASWEP